MPSSSSSNDSTAAGGTGGLHGAQNGLLREILKCRIAAFPQPTSEDGFSKLRDFRACAQ